MADEALGETIACSKCGAVKPWTLENFQMQKGRLRRQCRKCRALLQKDYGADWQAKNAEAVKARKREYREANLGKARASSAKWAERNATRRAACIALWREANKDRVSECARARLRIWRQKNPEASIARSACRRAMRAAAPGKHGAADIRTIYANQHGKCAYCQKDVGRDYHVDHYVPLSKGGSNWPSNLRIACPRCNMSKRDKMPEDFMRKCSAI